MMDPETDRHIEVKDGDQTVADADVSAPAEPEGTARASLRAASGHIAPGRRASLVDAVMDLPEVQESSRLDATVPMGDGETLERLRQRADAVTTRPAGSTTLVDAAVRPAEALPAGKSPAPAGESPSHPEETGRESPADD